MSAGIKAIAFSTPIIASNLVFSQRRLTRGTNAISNDPVYGLMNYDIAAGQMLKGVRAAQDLSEPVAKSAADAIKNSTQVAERTSKLAKIGKGFMKIVNFTADHINPIIYLTGAWKTFNSDDKLSTGIEQLSAIGTMRLGEIGYSRLLAMPYYTRNKETGVLERVTRKSPLLSEAQAKALADTIETKKIFAKIPLKPLAHTAKGLGFVATSIGSYALGELIGTSITGRRSEV